MKEEDWVATWIMDKIFLPLIIIFSVGCMLTVVFAAGLQALEFVGALSCTVVATP